MTFRIYLFWSHSVFVGTMDFLSIFQYRLLDFWLYKLDKSWIPHGIGVPLYSIDSWMLLWFMKKKIYSFLLVTNSKTAWWIKINLSFFSQTMSFFWYESCLLRTMHFKYEYLVWMLKENKWSSWWINLKELCTMRYVAHKWVDK